MKVCVYVEGPSDKAAMEALLRPLIEQQRQAGIAVDFFETPPGDRKVSLLTKVPRRAVNILAKDPQAIVRRCPIYIPATKPSTIRLSLN